MILRTLCIGFAALSLSTSALAAGIVSPAPSGFAFGGQQIVDRLQAALADPARFTGVFTGPTHTGRVASVTNCKGDGSNHSAVYTCDLVGVPVGTTANFQVTVFNSKVASVMLSVQNNIRADSGLTAVTAIMLEGAVIQAVDPLAQKTGVSAKTHEVLIMDGLSPGAHMSLRKDVRADGLTFEQRMVAGDLVLDVHPTGGI